MSASGAAEASSSSGPVEGPQQAGPLPTKVGEIGYNAEMHEVDLTAAPTTGDQTSSSGAAATATRTPSRPTPSVISKRSALSRFFNKKAIGGISNSVLLRIVLLFLLIGFTATGWALAIKNYQSPSTSTSASPDTESLTEGLTATSQGAMRMSSIIFIHIAFAVATLLELLFFERAIFQARAERYNHINGSPTGSTASAMMSLAPWNRPPLPTYAAAIAGRTTGDVEDAIIVQPPPPAYGNIRGSVLLLAGRLRDSMRSQRTVRQSGASTRTTPPMTEARTGRPISYGESEEISDAARARALERALARLEEGSEQPRQGS